MVATIVPPQMESQIGAALVVVALPWQWEYRTSHSNHHRHSYQPLGIPLGLENYHNQSNQPQDYHRLDPKGSHALDS